MIGTVFIVGALICLAISSGVGVYINAKDMQGDYRQKWVNRAKVWIAGACLFLTAWVIQALFKM